MPLSSGPGSLKGNMHELMRGKPGKARAKAIKTIAKKRGISMKEARQKQAVAISMRMEGSGYGAMGQH